MNLTTILFSNKTYYYLILFFYSVCINISNTLMTYHKPQSTHPQDHYYRALDIHSWPRFHQRKARIWHTWGSSVFHKGHGDLGNIKLNQNMQSKDSTTTSTSKVLMVKIRCRMKYDIEQDSRRDLKVNSLQQTVIVSKLSTL